MAAYRPEYVAAFFDQYAEQEWERLVRTPEQEVKLHVHAHYLHRYLERGSRVLEVGAGPGRFTQVLAGLGCRVLVADISPVQLELNRRQSAELGFASAVEDWLRLDICDMNSLASGSFDAVVSYGGPLSYVFEQRDVALAECMRVTRPSGTILLSVMSLWGSVHALLGDVLPLPTELNREVIRSGDTTEGAHRCHMYRSAEVRDMLDRVGLETVAMSASNCISTGWDSLLADIRQDEEKWRAVLEMEVEACREPGSLDMGTHLIAVARKVA